MLKGKQVIARSEYAPDLCVVRGELVLGDETNQTHVDYFLFDVESCLYQTKNNAHAVSAHLQLPLKSVSQLECTKLFDDSMPEYITVH